MQNPADRDNTINFIPSARGAIQGVKQRYNVVWLLRVSLTLMYGEWILRGKMEERRDY